MDRAGCAAAASLSRLPPHRRGCPGRDTGRISPRCWDHARPVGPDAGLAELASPVTGDAHGLDDGAPAAALVLRGLAFALRCRPPRRPPNGGSLAARRRQHRRGIRHGYHLGTSPAGQRPLVGMMRERADLGLVTHLTVHELRGAPCSTSPA